MNKKSLLWLAPMIMLLMGRAWAAELPWEMKTPFKEATIRYELTGADNGTETLYVKDYGRRQARQRVSTLTMMGTTNKTNTLQITDPDWVYQYDLATKKGSKTTNPLKVYKEEYSKLSAEEKKNFEKNAKEFGVGMAGQFAAQVKQKGAKVLDYDCDVTTIKGMSTVYVLSGSNIVLRSEVSVMGMNNITAASKVDTAAAVPDSVFAPPAGIVPALDQQADAMMAGMIKDTVTTLAKPDGAKLMREAGPMGGRNMQQQMQKAMQEEGMSPEEQQEAMRQLQEAMQQMQKAKQPAK